MSGTLLIWARKGTFIRDITLFWGIVGGQTEADNASVKATRSGSQSDAQQAHWDAVYERLTPAGVSWYEPEASLSLALVKTLELPLDTPVIDVGGGASTLVDGLIAQGFSDVSVLDLSSAALDSARRRLGAQANVRWIHADLLQWQPDRKYGLWHDRAVYHFLTDPQDQRSYLNLLAATVGTPGYVILGTFAPEGPEACSGLPVVRYGVEELTAALGSDFEVIGGCRQDHVTPAGMVQPFTWVIAAAK
jgi:hypothetical protein